nr:immunoglobulin light chain junction region [Macaca mulatta]MPN65543.1 immunoglobulin light chain junction region [Macaca mulatta]MPN65605.1 immunoglobulin light chain junction region [Macaca mulatta]MPN65862.1 immunoglobulin light chain junction region [Macaca mulatta]MPN66033.1 immunoglobulin light chain junction region [Macaca mulatta]
CCSYAGSYTTYIF